MKGKVFATASCFVLIFVFAISGSAQRRARLGKVCGNPNIACKGSDTFQSYDIPFDTGRNFVIAESEFFYAIVLESVKLGEGVDCMNLYGEDARLATQKLFPGNKVFAMKCSEPGENYYTNVAEGTAFMGVYAGRSLAEANTFLKKVKATAKFSDVKVRRMQAGINGT